MALIALDQIVEGANARALNATTDDDEGFRRSVAAQGVLQPILLRPRPASSEDVVVSNALFEIVLGHRRWRAAAFLGLTEIPAEIRSMTDAEVAAAQLAENVQRQDMHPVDLWKGVRGLIQDHGMSFDEAAAALGLDHRVTRRLEMLGRLDPGVLALCELHMPSERTLRAIAKASAKTQAKAVSGKGLVSDFDGKVAVNWHDLTKRCEVERVSRSLAIFDWRSAGLFWDEDLFAEPGSDDQFTTADVDGFLKHQREALDARVESLAAATKGRHLRAQMKPNGWEVALPAGATRVIIDADPEKLKRRERAFHAMKTNGEILVWIATDPAKPAVRLADAPAAPGADAAADDADDAPAFEIAEATKPPFTKKGLTLLAEAKTAAIRAALLTAPTTAAGALALLLLALGADNVSIAGADRAAWRTIVARLLEPGGNLLELSDEELAAFARAAVVTILKVSAPDAPAYNPGSGAAAEWVGAAARAADHLGRFDTPDFLAAANLTELKRAAEGAGLLASGTASELRERLAGRAETYRPALAQFGAPTPFIPSRGKDEADV